MNFTKKLKLLDVGCGDKPHPNASVCGDLYLGKTVHRTGGKVIKPRKLGNFVRFDAYHLPFKDKCFNVVYTSHVLEHLEKPLNVLKEWKRVADTKVIVKVPDGRGVENRESKGHLYTWTKPTLENLLTKIFEKAEVHEEASPLLWIRAGFAPRLFNFMIKRFLWKLFIFKKPYELVGIGETQPVIGETFREK